MSSPISYWTFRDIYRICQKFNISWAKAWFIFPLLRTFSDTTSRALLILWISSLEPSSNQGWPGSIILIVRILSHSVLLLKPPAISVKFASSKIDKIGRKPQLLHQNYTQGNCATTPALNRIRYRDGRRAGFFPGFAARPGNPGSGF